MARDDGRAPPVTAGPHASRIERGIDRGAGPPDANQEGLAAAYEGMTAGSGS